MRDRERLAAITKEMTEGFQSMDALLSEALSILSDDKHDPNVETIAPDMPLVSLPMPDRAMHRAAVDAGYASLEDYIKIYGGDE